MKPTPDHERRETGSIHLQRSNGRWPVDGGSTTRSQSRWCGYNPVSCKSFASTGRQTVGNLPCTTPQRGLIRRGDVLDGLSLYLCNPRSTRIQDLHSERPTVAVLWIGTLQSVVETGSAPVETDGHWMGRGLRRRGTDVSRVRQRGKCPSEHHRFTVGLVATTGDSSGFWHRRRVKGPSCFSPKRCHAKSTREPRGGSRKS